MKIKGLFIYQSHFQGVLHASQCLPAGIFEVWPQIHHKPSTSVQLHAAPDGVGPQFTLGLVNPGAVTALWIVATLAGAPAWTVGVHVLQFPWVWSVAVPLRLLHGGSHVAGVFTYSNLAKTSVTHQLGVSICDESCERFLGFFICHNVLIGHT